MPQFHCGNREFLIESRSRRRINRTSKKQQNRLQGWDVRHINKILKNWCPLSEIKSWQKHDTLCISISFEVVPFGRSTTISQISSSSPSSGWEHKHIFQVWASVYMATSCYRNSFYKFFRSGNYTHSRVTLLIEKYSGCCHTKAALEQNQAPAH